MVVRALALDHATRSFFFHEQSIKSGNNIMAAQEKEIFILWEKTYGNA